MGGSLNRYFLLLLCAVFVSFTFGEVTVNQECGTVEILRNYTAFESLRGCRVIKGFLIIAHMSEDFSVSQYANITFPELREITEFLILYSVPGLKTLRIIFPNLTVIRGRRLFLDYALGIFSMPDLITIDLKSLIAIQKGSVFIAKCPQLCYLSNVYWDRLTLSLGQNHIASSGINETCIYNQCGGCLHCWSNIHCQKGQNTNLNNLKEGIKNCHINCLGGCYNSTNSDCVVCKTLTDQGQCVTVCPKDKYLSDYHQRCYTRSQCIENNGLIYQQECVPSCPSGYSIDKIEHPHECLPCKNHCPTICEGDSDYQLSIENLASADAITGCEIVNASLIIHLRNLVDINALSKSLGNIKEIRGYLKVFRSPYLFSLSFLRSLKKVNGDKLHDDAYAMVIYDNKNLKDLWSIREMKNIKLLNGSIFIHSNNKLCNKRIQAIRNNLDHDNEFDSIQINDQEVLCDSNKINVDFLVLSHDKCMLYWPKNQTESLIEILYREVSENLNIFEKSELDDNVCERILWSRTFIEREDLIISNSSHYSYNLTNLEQNTRYAYFLKTFDVDQLPSAQSEIHFFKTFNDIPSIPEIKTLSKNVSSITLEVINNFKNPKQEILYYHLDIFTQPDDKDFTDTRNYCSNPIFSTGYHQTTDDYDECCTRKENLINDKKFASNMEDMYQCSMNSLSNCDNLTLSKSKLKSKSKMFFKSLHVFGNQTEIIVTDLNHFTLYIFYITACNDILCGSYYIYSERTSALLENDLVKDLWACMNPDTKTFHVRFSEPPNPNGVVVAYVVHFRQLVLRNGSKAYHPGTNCITRLQHEKSNYEFIAQLKVPFEDVAIRTNSLSERSKLSDWIPIQECQRKGLSSFVIILFLFIFGALIAGGWYAHKKRLWIQCIPLLAKCQLNTTRSDEEILMEDFEVVRFQDLQNDDLSD